MTAALLLARAHWKLIGLGLLCLLLAAAVVRGNHYRNQRDEARINLNECREGRKQDRASYEQAQRDAKAKNDADVARIKAEQEKVNAEAKSRYQRDLRRLRAGGLRKDLAAPPRNPGKPKAGPAPGAACRDDEQNMCVSRARVLQAAEIELGRNALIDWINEQLGVKR